LSSTALARPTNRKSGELPSGYGAAGTQRDEIASKPIITSNYRNDPTPTMLGNAELLASQKNHQQETHFDYFAGTKQLFSRRQLSLDALSQVRT
jgi:hypothetical protein